MNREEALGEISERLASTRLGVMAGKALYSSKATLRPGELYIAGFNPGGSPEIEKSSILESLGNTRESEWTEYTHGKWMLGKKNDYCPGKQPRQIKIQEFANRAGFKLAETFCTNAIWARGIDVKQTRAGEDFQFVADECAAMHRILLRLVRPRIILCFGRDAVNFFEQYDLTEVAGAARCSAGSNNPDVSLFYAPHFARGSKVAFLAAASQLRELF